MSLSELPGASRVPFARFASAQAIGAAPTPVEAGEEKLTVTITAQFELTQ
jgi:uncharacterized protein YggE